MVQLLLLQYQREGLAQALVLGCPVSGCSSTQPLSALCRYGCPAASLQRYCPPAQYACPCHDAAAAAGPPIYSGLSINAWTSQQQLCAMPQQAQQPQHCLSSTLSSLSDPVPMQTHFAHLLMSTLYETYFGFSGLSGLQRYIWNSLNCSSNVSTISVTP